LGYIHRPDSAILKLIAKNNGLPGAQHQRNRLGNGYLRGFINNQKIDQVVFHGKMLRNQTGVGNNTGKVVQQYPGLGNRNALAGSNGGLDALDIRRVIHKLTQTAVGHEPQQFLGLGKKFRLSVPIRW